VRRFRRTPKTRHESPGKLKTPGTKLQPLEANEAGGGHGNQRDGGGGESRVIMAFTDWDSGPSGLVWKGKVDKKSMGGGGTDQSKKVRTAKEKTLEIAFEDIGVLWAWGVGGLVSTCGKSRLDSKDEKRQYAQGCCGLKLCQKRVTIGLTRLVLLGGGEGGGPTV